jgi:twinkle protein
MRYQVAIVLVAHPRKSQMQFTNDDVSGSSDITNKVDVVMSYSRAEDPDASYQSILQVTKNRLWGKLRIGTDAIRLRYSEATKRVFNDEPEKPRVYGWEFEGIDAADFDLPFD